jgi:hypothetical protein
MRALFLALTFATTLIAQAAAGGLDLSDADAKKGIEGNWNNMTANLLLGERRIDKDAAPASCTDETMNLAQYDFLIGAVMTGYVKISYWSGQEFEQNKEFNRDEMLAFAAAGKIKKFTVTPTRRAERWKTDLSITGRTGCLQFRVGEYEVNKVVGNEPFRQADTDFRKVRVHYRVIYMPMMLDIREAGKIKWTPNRKADVLIQYSPEKNNWLVAASDSADEAGDFTTTNIANYLAKLK